MAIKSKVTMLGLTDRQKEILRFIQGFMDSEGMSPTVYEIADRFRIKTSSVFAHLAALQKKGFIRRSSKARSISIIGKYSAKNAGTAYVQRLGSISAGPPVENPEIKDLPMALDKSFFRISDSSRVFCLRVSGDSMSDEGILDGDTVVARKEDGAPRDGDIIVALIDKGETTVKKFYSAAGGRVELRPANKTFKTIYYNPERILVQGKVIGLLRSLA